MRKPPLDRMIHVQLNLAVAQLIMIKCSLRCMQFCPIWKKSIKLQRLSDTAFSPQKMHQS